MKERVLAETANVKGAKKCIAYLQNRPKTEMVGLGLLYGAPGLGKTRFAKRLAYTNDYIYLRLEASMTAKVFARELLRLINYRFGYPDDNLHGSTSTLLRRCISVLHSYPEAVIIIDEIDYAFNQPMLLGSIRDIVDETLAIVVLVGMKDAREKLLKANAHYFDRCNFFCEFKELGKDDIQQICDEVASVKLSGDIVKYLHGKTKGNIRKLVKSLYSIEGIARELDVAEFGIEHLQQAKIA